MANNKYYLESNNSITFCRFLLSKETEPILYWTGTEWTESRGKALLYADPDVALGDMQKFRVLDFGPCTAMTFEMPVKVDVHSRTAVDLDDLKCWLKKALGFFLDLKTHGNGPTGDSLVVVEIAVEELRLKQ